MNSPKMRGISCYDVEFRLIGENGLASVMLVQKGCYRLPGMIKGIRFVTKGSGAFDYVRLIDNQGELLFDDNFGK